MSRGGNKFAYWTVRSLISYDNAEVLLSVEYGDMGAALARLSPEMRAVIQAVVLDGLSAREAAQLLNVPVSSVKTRLFRAKAHLRATLAEGLS